MPLFSSKKHDNDNTEHVLGSSGHDYHQHGQHTAAGTGNVNSLGQTQGVIPGTHTDTNVNNFQPNASHHTSGQPFESEPYNAQTGFDAQRHGGGQGLPPLGDTDHGAHRRSGSHGTGARLTGKIESAIGSLVGSDALKAKGLQKENEANSIKLQGRELAEAERLEREAMARRERAVAHGADPANSVLGAGNPAVGNKLNI